MVVIIAQPGHRVIVIFNFDLYIKTAPRPSSILIHSSFSIMPHPALILTCVLVSLVRADLDDIQKLNELQNGGGKEETSYKSSGMGKILRHYLESNDIRLGDGVHIVKMEGSTPRADDDSFLGTVDSYLQTHEVKIRLADFMPEQLGQNKALTDSSEETGGVGKFLLQTLNCITPQVLGSSRVGIGLYVTLKLYRY